MWGKQCNEIQRSSTGASFDGSTLSMWLHMLAREDLQVCSLVLIKKSSSLPQLWPWVEPSSLMLWLGLVCLIQPKADFTSVLKFSRIMRVWCRQG
ncbi:Sodium transport ATPase 5 [Fusarium oxysporum f. sp. albedinis]|nr:Sodium transport ATPase 5 [Fusarium oxysporum f. sp. albedinis]